MCSFLSNAMFNNNLFSSGKLEPMKTSAKQRHETLQRLLAVAFELAGIEGPAALAFALAQSEQTVTNWGSRGVSKAGAILAQEKFGCSANWILHNTLPRLVGSNTLPAQLRAEAASQPASTDLDAALQTLSGYLSTVSESRRRSVVGLFTDLIHSPGDEQILELLKTLLESQAFAQSQKKSA